MIRRYKRTTKTLLSMNRHHQRRAQAVMLLTLRRRVRHHLQLCGGPVAAIAPEVQLQGRAAVMVVMRGGIVTIVTLVIMVMVIMMVVMVMMVMVLPCMMFLMSIL